MDDWWRDRKHEAFGRVFVWLYRGTCNPDTITAFSTLPALLITILAIVCFTASVALVGTLLLLWVVRAIDIPGWGWAGLGFLGLWNIQFLCLAMLGEFIVRTHKHTQRRPLYLIDQVIEHKTPIG